MDYLRGSELIAAAKEWLKMEEKEAKELPESELNRLIVEEKKRWLPLFRDVAEFLKG